MCECRSWFGLFDDDDDVTVRMQRCEACFIFNQIPKINCYFLQLLSLLQTLQITAKQSRVPVKIITEREKKKKSPSRWFFKMHCFLLPAVKTLCWFFCNYSNLRESKEALICNLKTKKQTLVKSWNLLCKCKIFSNELPHANSALIYNSWRFLKWAQRSVHWASRNSKWGSLNIEQQTPVNPFFSPKIHRIQFFGELN